MATTASTSLERTILIDDLKVNKGMRKALEGLMSMLKCPLCNELFERPTTLASCGHSFCESCIDDYSSRASVCPEPGCGMPMSIVGGRRGSYRNVNPQLVQSVESLQRICEGLNRAPDKWWLCSTLQAKEAPMTPATPEEKEGDDSDSDNDTMVDLQGGQ
eukprot:Nitzschia sp. Nitz4//scaffold102_size76354//72338//72883//NITZ4_005644-RA/size76354-snap-gene-0.143-mRNA-1//-1//CDS//3329532285//1779//frame0